MDAFLRLAKGLSPSNANREAEKGEDQGQGEDGGTDNQVASSPSPDVPKHDTLSSAQVQRRKSTGAVDAIEAALSSGAPGSSRRTKTSHGTALSDESSITFNIDEGDVQSQLEVTAITMYATDLVKTQLRKQVAVNENYICYALKTGHLRVLSKRHAGHKALIKGLQAPVTDMSFQHYTSNRLATADAHGRVMIHLLTDIGEGIVVNALLDLNLGSLQGAGSVVRLTWADTSAMGRDSVLAISTLSGVLSVPWDAHTAVREAPDSIDADKLPETVNLLQTGVEITALAASSRWLAAGTSNGKVMLWSLDAVLHEGSGPSSQAELSESASGVGSIHWLEGPAASAAEQTATLVVGDAFNRQLQLFSVQADGSLQQEQTLQLESKDGEAGLCNAIAVQPQADLVVLANVDRKAVYVLHVRRSDSARFDNLTKYQLGWPILSMEAESELSNGVARLFCVQTHAIQAYNLQLADCTPQPKFLAAPQQLIESLSADPEREAMSAAPVSNDVMPSHMLADSEEEESASRPQSAGSAAVAASPDQDMELPRPPPPVTTPPAAAVPQPRLLTPKQLKQLAGSRAGSLGSAASADAGAARDGHPGSGQSFGLQRAPTPPAKPPSPALSGSSAAFGERPSVSEAVAPPASSLPMFGGTIAGGEPVAVSQAPEPPSPALNGTATPPMKILKRKKDGDSSSTQPDTEEKPSEAYAQSSLAAAKTKQLEGTPAKAALDTPGSQADATSLPSPVSAPTPTPTPVPPTEPPTLPPRSTPGRAEAPDQAAKLEALHKKLLLEMRALQAAQLKTLRDDMRKESKRTEAATQAQVSRLVQMQKETLADERAIVLGEHKAELKTLVSVMSASINRDLPVRIEEMVGRAVASSFAQMQRVTGEAVKAAAQEAIAEALPRELAGPALKAALERSLAAQLRTAVAQPLQDGFRASFQGTLLPAFESACQTMFSQVQATFAGGLAEHLQAAGGASAAIAASLRESVSQMSSATDRLNSQVAEGQQRLVKLAEEAADVKPRMKALTLSQIEARVEDPTIALKQLIKQHKYEEAFAKVLDMSDVDRVTWVCQQLDPAQLLAQEPLPLSQSVLLSLMQQLGSQLGKDTAVKLLWIKEAAPNLDPNDALLAPHMREILQALYQQLHACLVSSPPQQARTTKVVVHLVNSLLHQCQ